MDLKFVHICFDKLELAYIFKNLGWSYIHCVKKDKIKYKNILWYTGDYKFKNELKVIQDLRVFCATSIDEKFCLYLFYIRINNVRDNKIVVNFRSNIFRRFAVRRGGYLSDVTHYKINTYAGKSFDNLKNYYALYFELEENFIKDNNLEILTICDNIKIASKLLSYPTKVILKHKSIYIDV